MDTQLKKICRGGKEYGLTPTEYDILMFFINHEGQSVTAEELYHFIWNTECYGEIRTIVVHISNLRKRLAMARRICGIFTISGERLLL